MKSTRKHELQTNELADAIWRLVEAARPHLRLIVYVAAAVLLLVFVFVILPHIRGGGAEGLSAYAFRDAQQRGEAQGLRDFLKDFPQAPEGPAALLLLADRLVAEVVRGTRDVVGPEGKAKAAGLLAEARELYEQAGKSLQALDPLVQVDLAMLTVQAGDVEKGVAALQEIGKKWPDSVAAGKAKAHIEELAGYKPMKFSDEPLEEEKKPETKAGAPTEGAAKEPPPAKAETKPPETKASEAPKTAPEKPAEAPKAPAGGEKPASAAPKG
jgi:hypothetical protein